MPDSELQGALASYGVGWERPAYEAIVAEAKRRGMAAPEGPPAVAYRIFRATLTSWPALFENACAFATEVGRKDLIGISHSADMSDGVVCVWYWTRSAPGSH